MSALLGFSITSLDTETVEGQERMLRVIADRFPGIVFNDVIWVSGDPRPVRIDGHGITAVPVGPTHAGATLGSFGRELMWPFEEGDLLLPHQFEATELDLGLGHPRIVCSHATMLRDIDDYLADAEAEVDAEERTFLRVFRENIAIAAEERLPLVAHW